MNKKFTPIYDNDLIPLWFLKKQGDNQTIEFDNELKKLKQEIIDTLNITSGSNENGSWVKYPDGTMICYMSVTAEVTFNNVWYAEYSGTMDLGYFPQRFVEVPNVQLSNHSTSAVTFQNYVLLPTEAHPGSALLTRPISDTTDVTIDIMAIGKWK